MNTHTVSISGVPIAMNFEKALIETFAKYEFTPNQCYEAAKYALFSGGKRLRPYLFLSSLESFGHPLHFEPAISLEMIHTYSLIHDDLPAMDNDDFRRGKPTVHKVFPEGIAILAGDFLLTTAFEIVTECRCEATKKVALVETLAKASGMHGMIGGQTLDLLTQDKEHLYEMHRLKTGALMGAALESAAILMDKDRSSFKELGQSIGVAFQIKNDLNDERGSDKRNLKITYAHLDNPTLLLHQEQEKIYILLGKLSLNNTPLEAIIKTVLV